MTTIEMLEQMEKKLLDIQDGLRILRCDQNQLIGLLCEVEHCKAVENAPTDGANSLRRKELGISGFFSEKAPHTQGLYGITCQSTFRILIAVCWKPSAKRASSNPSRSKSPPERQDANRRATSSGGNRRSNGTPSRSPNRNPVRI